jgi:hypothetical protein
MLHDWDDEKVHRVRKALLSIAVIDIAGLERAYKVG